MSDLFVAAAVLQAERKRVWDIKARIISVLADDAPRLPAGDDTWMSLLKIVGSVIEIKYDGSKVKNLVFHPGMLFRIPIPEGAVETSLDQIASGKDCVLSLTPDILRPMDEPCVRVPLSLLKELRGQEAGIEYSRRALVTTWSKDRKTGHSAKK